MLHPELTPGLSESKNWSDNSDSGIDTDDDAHSVSDTDNDSDSSFVQKLKRDFEYYLEDFPEKYVSASTVWPRRIAINWSTY